MAKKNNINQKLVFYFIFQNKKKSNSEKDAGKYHWPFKGPWQKASFLYLSYCILYSPRNGICTTPFWKASVHNILTALFWFPCVKSCLRETLRYGRNTQLSGDDHWEQKQRVYPLAAEYFTLICTAVSQNQISRPDHACHISVNSSFVLALQWDFFSSGKNTDNCTRWIHVSL